MTAAGLAQLGHDTEEALKSLKKEKTGLKFMPILGKRNKKHKLKR